LIEPDVSIDAHLIRADQALYAAKEAGRARLVIWSEPSPPPTEDGLKKSAA
jgi:predicted signal transduction protein with EAL and GGDEF domain